MFEKWSYCQFDNTKKKHTPPLSGVKTQRSHESGFRNDSLRATHSNERITGSPILNIARAAAISQARGHVRKSMLGNTAPAQVSAFWPHAITRGAKAAERLHKFWNNIRWVIIYLVIGSCAPSELVV